VHGDHAAKPSGRIVLTSFQRAPPPSATTCAPSTSSLPHVPDVIPMRVARDHDFVLDFETELLHVETITSCISVEPEQNGLVAW
jgi:hypothetical protein